MVSGVAATIINTIVLAIGYPIFLHYLDYELYGVWLLLSTVLTFARLGNLGIGQAVMKLVAEEYGRKDIKGIQQYIITALAMICLSGFAVLVALLLLEKPIVTAFRLSGENSDIFSGLLPYIGMLSIFAFVVDILQGTLSGLGRMDITNYIQVAGRTIQILVACILLILGIGIKSMLVGYIASYLFIYLSLIFCIKQKISVKIFDLHNLEIKKCRKLLSFGGNIFASSILNMLFNPFNKLMLSRYGGVAVVPIYEIAYSGSMQVRALFEVALKSLMPEISKLNSNLTMQARNRIHKINHLVMKIIFIMGIPTYGILALFSPFLFKIWLKEEFVVALPNVFRVMLFGTYLSLLGVPAYYLLLGLGQVRRNLESYIIQTMVNLIIIITSILFISSASLYIVIFATTIGMGASTAYLIWQRQIALKNICFENNTISISNDMSNSLFCKSGSY